MEQYRFGRTAVPSSDGHGASFPGSQSGGATTDHQLGPPARSWAGPEGFPWADWGELGHRLWEREHGTERFALVVPLHLWTSHLAWYEHKEQAVEIRAWFTGIIWTASLIQATRQLIFEGAVSVSASCGQATDWPVNRPRHLHLLGHLRETHHQLQRMQQNTIRNDKYRDSDFATSL